MPAFSYVVTSSKPTSVSNAVVGSFTAPGARDLIVAKTSRLELFSIEADGLSPLFEVQVYGRISSMETFRPAVSAARARLAGGVEGLRRQAFCSW
tara:strand:- start:1031 stop:1315 length:285 start_codon:yes stop_codon:yes gene_type:complete